jgi:V/A-type H+-transporting ATPase subunit A
LYDFADWSANSVAPEWNELTSEAMALLQHEAELLGIVQLVGPDALAETERAVLAVARMLREDFLHQSAYHPVDRFCPLDKDYWMLKVIMDFYHRTQAVLKMGVALERVTRLPIVAEIARMKEIQADQAVEQIKGLMARTRSDMAELGAN